MFDLKKQKLSKGDAIDTYESLRMRRMEKDNQGMDRKNEGQEDAAAIHARKEREASGDSVVIAGAINNLADAIREHARAMKGEYTEMDDGQFDLAGERIA